MFISEIEELEMKKNLCDYVIASYEAILTREAMDDMDIIENAKNEELKNAISSGMSEREQNLIKQKYLVLEYKKFADSCEDNIYAKDVLNKVGRELSSRKNSPFISSCGFTLGTDSTMDSKTLFANYKTALNKNKQLEAMINLKKF